MFKAKKIFSGQNALSNDTVIDTKSKGQISEFDDKNSYIYTCAIIILVIQIHPYRCIIYSYLSLRV